VRVRAISILVALLALAGCSVFVPKLETPKLSVVDVQILKSSIWQQQLRVRMHVDNPNDRALPIKGLTYVLEVNGQEFAHGQSAASFIVPALGEAEFDTNVTANLAGTLISMLGHGSDALGQSVDYHLSGKVLLSEGLLRSVPFDQHGTFKLQN
jgi:LEA14-like dessication related protein